MSDQRITTIREALSLLHMHSPGIGALASLERELADLRAFAAEISGLVNDLGTVPNPYPDDLRALAENLRGWCADTRAENERLRDKVARLREATDALRLVDNTLTGPDDIVLNSRAEGARNVARFHLYRMDGFPPLAAVEGTAAAPTDEATA